MYRVKVKRHCENNPLTGRVRLRVVDCWKGDDNSPFYSSPVVLCGGGMFIINLPKPRRVGTFINPRWALFGRGK